MSFKNLSVGRKLWIIVLGLMLAMLALNIGSQWYLTRVAEDTSRVVQFNEERAALALRWKVWQSIAWSTRS